MNTLSPAPSKQTLKPQTPRNRQAVAWFSAIGVLLASLGALSLLFWLSGYEFRWDVLLTYRAHLQKGFFMTVCISLGAFAISVPLSLMFLWGQQNRILPLAQFSKGLNIFLRGTPLLIQILIWYYIVFDLLGISSALFSGMLILAFFSASYMSEIFRGGLESIAASQSEAAKSLGFTPLQFFIYIAVPQVFKRTLPAMAGQLMNLVKDSSLLSIISIVELTRASQEAVAYSFSTFELYLASALTYLVLTLPIMLFTRYLEKRFSYESA